jgi:hypothetical protein
MHERRSSVKHKALNQLICAATVNGRFRETLLRDPAQALAAGYFDYAFPLTPEERDLVIGIQAQKLEDFAAQIHCWLSGNGNGNGHNGNGKNGHSLKHSALGSTESLVDLYSTRMSVPA